ncbi:zinc transporter 1 isoform X2 [Coccinella septempunctata]|nr:zinc transporter 1 isoform X2 [Coccinella septempunctata]XP_044748982.1 zinc transporter 1 isoform X2 [Coccinella septempunctata]XP_044748983.1 zinc transporter 1 isoform X2 [Coccinella septempunctata]
MTVKEWFRKYQPLQLYIVLILTILFLTIQLVVSHITHALTLLMNSYQMLCNVLALIGYIITIKFQSRDLQDLTGQRKNVSPNGTDTTNKEKSENSKLEATEHKLKNTFGWARIDVVSMLICCVFCGSLCFSVIVEALQTLFHIDHLHEMHNPISVFCMGAASFLLNVLCFILIGGYTFHQGSFLYVTEGGEVVLNRVPPMENVRQGERRLSRTKTFSSELRNKRQNFREMVRDTLGSVLVIISAVLVYFAHPGYVKYVDPAIAVIHAISLMQLSFPYMKESCFILLQTMPGSINIDSLKVDLLKQFPDIVNVHDFHVWQLTTNKVISTVHIIFQSPEVYKRIKNELINHFNANGITQVTIQPEFFTKAQKLDAITSTNMLKCLMACQESCGSWLCCPESEEEKNELKEITCGSKESLPDLTTNTVISSQPEPTQENSSEEMRNPAVPPLEKSSEDKNLLRRDQKLNINAQEFVNDVKEEMKANM